MYQLLLSTYGVFATALPGACLLAFFDGVICQLRAMYREVDGPSSRIPAA